MTARGQIRGAEHRHGTPRPVPWSKHQPDSRRPQPILRSCRLLPPTSGLLRQPWAQHADRSGARHGQSGAGKAVHFNRAFPAAIPRGSVQSSEPSELRHSERENRVQQLRSGGQRRLDHYDHHIVAADSDGPKTNFLIWRVGRRREVARPGRLGGRMAALSIALRLWCRPAGRLDSSGTAATWARRTESGSVATGFSAPDAVFLAGHRLAKSPSHQPNNH